MAELNFQNLPLKVTEKGLYCTDGDFYIDAWRPVPKCIVTHAHSDHAYSGHQHYIATTFSKPFMLRRLGANIPLETKEYGEKFKLGNCWVSLHPAGHILGSAQVRMEIKDRVYVVSGDYKRADDPTCAPFEVIPCDLFVTESTFGLPIYQWDSGKQIAKQVFDWWQKNSSEEHASVVFCYALGKAQRLMALLKYWTDCSIFLHGTVLPYAKIFADQGIDMVPFQALSEDKSYQYKHDLIIAPPSADGTPWLKRFGAYKSAFCSGWMMVRGRRRRRAVDQGFILSDHADWPGLLQTIKETQASHILTTHGSTAVLAKYLSEELGLQAMELQGLTTIEETED